MPKKTKLLEKLNFATQCRMPPKAENDWVTIAAFNHPGAAFFYADTCRNANAGIGMEYRVMEYVNGKWMERVNR